VQIRRKGPGQVRLNIVPFLGEFAFAEANSVIFHADLRLLREEGIDFLYADL
jgi:hypothetical protein